MLVEDDSLRYLNTKERQNWIGLHLNFVFAVMFDLAFTNSGSLTFGTSLLCSLTFFCISTSFFTSNLRTFTSSSSILIFDSFALPHDSESLLTCCLSSLTSLPDPRGAGLQEAFQFLSVRTSVTNSFSCVLLGQYTSDPQYFYRFRTPY